VGIIDEAAMIQKVVLEFPARWKNHICSRRQLFEN